MPLLFLHDVLHKKIDSCTRESGNRPVKAVKEGRSGLETRLRLNGTETLIRQLIRCVVAELRLKS